jgi:TolB-like protein
MPDQTKVPGAVFVSYASQDAESAWRISEALRSAGVEVWFDQSELRGGDAWDAKIRKQIKECTLFVPVISANTNARAEGYFRLEWHLAEQRTYLLAQDQPFLLPVTVDNIRSSATRVPERFHDRQWTRLTGEEALLAFAEQVRKLLGSQAAAASDRGASTQTAAPGFLAHERPARNQTSTTIRRKAHLVWPAAASIMVIGGLAVAFWPKLWPATALSKGIANPTTASHSIAVLPFTNMSDDKDSGYFGDGIQDEILADLASSHGLRVVSRTSVMRFRATTLSIQEIGKMLNVAYVLEGSVRGHGSKVRVTVQLIDSRTDDHAWAKSFDVNLADIFTGQTEVAKNVARELMANITPDHPSERPGNVP